MVVGDCRWLWVVGDGCGWLWMIVGGCMLQYNPFLNKLMKIINEIAPSREIRIENITQEWLDREIAELMIYACKKLFLKFKKSKLHID